MSTSTHPSTNGNANSSNNHDNGSTSNNDNPQAGQGRPLPKKEGDLFKALVKQYESKQYKKAIKAADTILKKFPNHGETLAMKGLTVYYSSSDRKEEAHQFVKLGLRNDMRSHVCWHVYGLLHRADRNYLEAIKAYKQALRIDHDNLQILRDLSLLQIQMRDLSGFVVTRNAILNLKPTAQTNWLSFAVAKHLQGNYEGALQVIDIYLGTLSEGSPELKRDYQPSELQMYKSYLLLQTNNPQAALDHLDQCRAVVMDRGAWLWYKTRCHMALQQYDDAKATLWQLFQRGATEDYRIHAAYQCATLQLTTNEVFAGMDTLATTRRLTADQKTQLLSIYENELKQEFPRSPAVQRIPLTLLEGDALATQLGIYIRKLLVKGVPSLALDLGSLVLQEDDNGRYNYIDNLRAHNKFHPDDPEEQEPSTIFWALFLQAGLQELAGNYTDALALVDECLQHTPTAVDVYEVLGRILQKSGDLKAAVEAIDKGRDLDQQDRYMNNQTTKYMLQANMPETALERIGLFTNNDANTSPDATLFDMQCSWYELELADCLARQGKYGRSLKKYAAVMKHFEDIHEDQFDFHSYCIRKVTLRAYCDVLDWEDALWGQPYYRRAAEGTIRLYKTIYDDPSILADLQEPDYSEMSAAEKKKAKAVARKKKKAAEKKAADGEEVEVEGKRTFVEGCARGMS
ncbi:NMDA receptor-regulated protein 1 [Fragilaria crotonensis]|nr:NMDA receptor-regulated protein 1 [Fragilaria crotonensis]